MLVAGCTNYSIYFFNLCHDLVFIAFCHASGDNQCLTSAAVFHFSHFKDGLDTLLLGVMDEAACIDNDDVCFYFIKPCARRMPSMTSESTRFLSQPRETKKIVRLLEFVLLINIISPFSGGVQPLHNYTSAWRWSLVPHRPVPV